MSDISQNWTDEPGLEVGEEVPRISASRIKKYRTCPKQYWFSYESELSGTKASKGYLDLGSAVHIAIENILDSGKPVKFRNKLAHDLKKEYKETAEAQRLKEFDDSMYRDGLGYLEVAARYIDGQDADITGVEKEVDYGLSRTDINARLKAIMDVTTENEIWDWKTGRIRDETPIDEKIQGAVYMKAYEEAYGEPPEEVRFVYLKEEKERCLDPSDETWEAMLKYCRTLMKGLRDEDFTANPGDACYFCSYELYCDASPAGVGNVDYEKF